MDIILSFIAAVIMIGIGIHAVIKQRSLSHFLLLFALVLLASIEILDLFSLHSVGGLTGLRRAALYLESLLPAAFLALSQVYGRSASWTRPFWLRLALYSALSLLPAVILFVSGTGLYISPDFPNEPILFLESEGFWFYLLLAVGLIVSLANMEATLAASRDLVRYSIKFEFFGMMAVLAFMIFYYSHAILYLSINMGLAFVRSIVFILASILIAYSRVFRGNGFRVSVSRHIFYRSATLLAVGIYLIIMGLMGEGMRYFDVDFGRNITILLAFVGAVFLLAVLFSDKARRRAKVYIHKHFYADKHDYREEWISLTERLSKCTTLDDIENAVLSAYMNTFGFAGASLSLADRTEGYVSVAAQSMPHAPTPLVVSDELKGYFLSRDRVLNPSDREHPLFPEEVELFRQAGVSLVVPLIANGRLEGLVMLREQLVPRVLIYDDYDLMKVMARQAAQAIVSFRLSEEIIEMNAMAAVARMSSFVIHDLKNQITSLSLVVDNAGTHMQNPEFQQDALRTIGNTLAKMRGLVQRLKSIPSKGSVRGAIEDIHALACETAGELRLLPGEQKVQCSGVSAYAGVDREEIKKVLVNLIRNGLEAGGEQVSVHVETFSQNGNVCVRVTDRGCGMTAEFMRNNLFRPFNTTKAKGLGIGLYQCRQIVEAHAGRIEVTSQPGKGSSFTVILPAADPQKEVLPKEN